MTRKFGITVKVPYFTPKTKGIDPKRRILPSAEASSLGSSHCTDEESGGSPGNVQGALVSDVVAVASGDTSAGGITVGISHRASLDLVSEETETTGLDAGGIPLIPLAACRSPTAYDQCAVAEPGLVGSGQHAAPSSAYIITSSIDLDKYLEQGD